MRFVRCLIMCAVIAGTCWAQLPEFYKRVDRVTWLVKALNHPLKGWAQLGLSNIREHGDLTFEGQYSGKAISIKASSATGSLGNLTVDMLQPGEGDNAFTEFLARHGDGIFSIVHEVATIEDMTNEIERMRGLGVRVLQQMTIKGDQGPVTLTYFDTEGQGKYVLGLIYWPGGAPATRVSASVSAPSVVKKLVCAYAMRSRGRCGSPHPRALPARRRSAPAIA